ncbi:meiotic recombination protein SPO11 [Neocloeon triangulifer]|uniref:meiotic recombination protein SPO11 n=1 Tax=Neocloeon triangulifer TaxID=2078957 RepID=UPI00286F19F0|nr:meiotic recombination protein SPO11 [Neocloeon triangulifer]
MDSAAFAIRKPTGFTRITSATTRPVQPWIVDELKKIRQENLGANVDYTEDPMSKLSFIPIQEPEHIRRGQESLKQMKKAKEEEDKRNGMKKKIEDTVLQMISDISKGNPISFKHSVVSWLTAEYKGGRLIYRSEDKQERVVSIKRGQSRHKLSLMVQLMERVHWLLQTNSTATKRELFYQFLLPNQAMLDKGVVTMSDFLKAAPWEFGIFSAGKGIVAGDLEIKFQDGSINCKRGVLIPANIYSASNLKSNANFVLIVEKDAIFHKILDGDLMDYYGSSILITGKGYPDLSTRLLVKMIWDKLKLPIFILVDADPHGIDIMCTYRFGSMAMCQFAAALAMPEIKWIGVHPSDIDKLWFKERVLIPFSTKDDQVALSLLNRPYVIENPAIKKQVDILLEKKVKAEIEALESFTADYLTDVYISSKLRSRSYI